MIVIDVIAAIVERVIGEVASAAVSSGVDRRRSFAKELLAYHEALGRYRDLCREYLALVERERRLVPSKRMTPGTARELQGIADGMTRQVSVIAGTFETEVLEALAGERLQRKRSKRRRKHARRRFGTLEVLDPNVANLVRRAMYVDVRTAYAISDLSRQGVDWQAQQITMPVLAGSPWQVDCPGEREEASTARPTTISFSDDDDVEALKALVRYNIETVDDLTTKMADFIRRNLTIDDLL